MKIKLKATKLQKAREDLVKVAVQVNGQSGPYQSHRRKNPKQALDLLDNELKRRNLGGIDEVSFKNKKTGKNINKDKLIKEYQSKKSKDTLQSFVAKNYQIVKTGGNKKDVSLEQNDNSKVRDDNLNQYLGDRPDVTPKGEKRMQIKAEEIDGDIYVSIPYNKRFIDDVKILHGKWDKERKQWHVDKDKIEKLDELLKEHYGEGLNDDYITIEFRPTLQFEDDDGDINISGVKLASRRYRDGNVSLTNGTRVAEGRFPERGGSINKPAVEAGKDVLLQSRIPKTAYDNLSDYEKENVKIIDNEPVKAKDMNEFIGDSPKTNPKGHDRMLIGAKVENGRIYVDTPYNTEFIRDVKEINGKWDPEKKEWSVDEIEAENLDRILKENYGEGLNDDYMVINYRPIDFEDNYDIVIGRFKIAERKNRDRGVTLSEGTELVEGKFPYSGGSRNNPAVAPTEDIVLRSLIPKTAYDQLSDKEKEKINIESTTEEEEKETTTRSTIIDEKVDIVNHINPYGANIRKGTTKIESTGEFEVQKDIQSWTKSVANLKDKESSYIVRSIMDAGGNYTNLFFKKDGQFAINGSYAAGYAQRVSPDGEPINREIGIVDNEDKYKLYKTTYHEMLHSKMTHIINKSENKSSFEPRIEEPMVELGGQALARMTFSEEEGNKHIRSYNTYIADFIPKVLDCPELKDAKKKGLRGIGEAIANKAYSGDVKFFDSLVKTYEQKDEKYSVNAYDKLFEENPDLIDKTIEKCNNDYKNTLNDEGKSELADLVEMIKRGQINIETALNNYQYREIAAILVNKMLEDEDIDALLEMLGL